ncbi:MAG: HAD family hydrolase [Actinomycetota bacterium]|nr:HAD family hydrolase [Actinomycetota bacterium]
MRLLEVVVTEPAVLLDLDGTLIDSVYQHVVTWDAAFREHGHRVPLWQLHAGIGMGSLRLVTWVLGGHVDEAEAISEGHRSRFLDLADDLRPTRGARELLEDLQVRDVPFLIATSAGEAVRTALMEVLGRPDLPTTDADDVHASKPAPDMLVTSLEELDAVADRATLVGDSPWDAEAAYRVGVRTIAVRTGGFGDQELMRAGASAVVDDPLALVGRL